MFRDIEDVRAYLAERNTSVFGLEAITNLLDLLGHPEEGVNFVHVTGTNGKGSTSQYLANILIDSGYKVGAFSSPAVFDDNEIIRLNNENISDADLLGLANRTLLAIEKMESLGMRLPTKFEIETAIAFLFFKEKAVDIAIVEVGMGGELDSTNVIKNTLVEIVTRISYDHMGILGSTLKEIATNKAGIIKPNSIVVTTGQDAEVIRVLEDKCHKTHSKLIIAGDGSKLDFDIKAQTIAYKGREYSTRLLGNYQIYNLPIAIESAKELKRLGFDKISDNSIYNGVANTTLAGRFEIIGNKPIFVLDGAHNDEASNMLRESIKTYFEGKKIVYILGIFKDKDYKKILDNTLDLAREIITFDWDNVRKLDGTMLMEEVMKHISNVKYVHTPEDAVRQALEDTDSGDVIVAFGSLSHLKDIRNAYKGVKNGRY